FAALDGRMNVIGQQVVRIALKRTYGQIAHGLLASKGQFARFAGLVAAPPVHCAAGSSHWWTDNFRGDDINPALQRLRLAIAAASPARPSKAAGVPAVGMLAKGASPYPRA